MESKRRGMIIILSSPSGGGKSTLSRKLLKELDNIRLSISYTTRQARENEVDGVDYYFIDKEEYERKIINNEFLECAEVFDNFYGTGIEPTNTILNSGEDLLLDIDWKGTRSISTYMREDVVSIFILPPHVKELEKRLKSRNTDSKETIDKRMKRSILEMEHWDEYDYVLVNENLDNCFKNIVRIVKVERLKRVREGNFKLFFEELKQQHTENYGDI